jgi:hypothetical protein
MIVSMVIVMVMVIAMVIVTVMILVIAMVAEKKYGLHDSCSNERMFESFYTGR